MTSNTEIFEDNEVIAVVTMMVCVVVVGGIGNMLVIIVECLKKISPRSGLGRRRRLNRLNADESMTTVNASGDKTLDFFILVLAISDLFVCLVIIPTTIQMELNLFRMENDLLCKLYYVIFVANTTFSSLLISAVALDRYLYICHSLKHILTLFRAKLMVISLALFAIFIGVMAGTAVGVKLAHSDSNTTVFNPTPVHVCEEQEFMSNITVFQKTFSTIVKRVNHGCFFICILIVTILYGFVFWAIVSAEGRRQRLVVKQTTPVTLDCNSEEKPEISFKSGTVLPITRNRSLSGKIVQRAHCTFQNIRSALMLFVVALVYIVTFVPVLLITNGWLPQNLFLIYFYYVNSAANPCIYAAFSKLFRTGVANIFQDFCCAPKSVIPSSARHNGGPTRTVSRRCFCLHKKKLQQSTFPFISREEQRAKSKLNNIHSIIKNGSKM